MKHSWWVRALKSPTTIGAINWWTWDFTIDYQTWDLTGDQTRAWSSATAVSNHQECAKKGVGQKHSCYQCLHTIVYHHTWGNPVIWFMPTSVSTVSHPVHLGQEAWTWGHQEYETKWNSTSTHCGWRKPTANQLDHDVGMDQNQTPPKWWHFT